MSSAAQKTFGHQSCRDMLGKLEREVQRLAKATKPDELADHAQNAAWTAWHLHEWIWIAICRNSPLRLKLAREAGLCSGRPISKKDYKDYVLSDNGCRDLVYCRITANNSKHLHSEPHPSDRDFDTTVAPGEIKWLNNKGQEVTFVNNKGEPITWTVEAEEITLIDEDGTRHRAAEVFGRVHDFWTRFVAENKIDET